MSDTRLHFLRFLELGGAFDSVSDMAWFGLFSGYALGFAFAAPVRWGAA